MQVWLSQQNLNLALSYTEQISQICQPLFNSTLISYFNYARKYSDGSNFSLTSLDGWTRYFYENELFINISEKVDSQLNSNVEDGYCRYFWFEAPANQATVVSKEKFNLNRGVTFVMVSKNFREHYYFGIEKDMTDAECVRYIHGIFQNLTHFILYFHDKAASIMKILIRKENGILLPVVDIVQNINSLPSGCVDHVISANISMPISKYRLIIRGKEIFLSLREAQCLSLLSKGENIKSIAKSLGKSERTIETYFNRLKLKLEDSGIICGTKIGVTSLFNNKFKLLMANDFLIPEFLDQSIWNDLL